MATHLELHDPEEDEQPLEVAPPSAPQPLAVAAADGPASPLASKRFFIETARERARAYVPTATVSEATARQVLIQMREEEIRPTFPDVKPNAGILRKSILDRLINEAIDTQDDFRLLIPSEAQAATDKDQLDAYLESILAILSRIR